MNNHFNQLQGRRQPFHFQNLEFSERVCPNTIATEQRSSCYEANAVITFLYVVNAYIYFLFLALQSLEELNVFIFSLKFCYERTCCTQEAEQV